MENEVKAFELSAKVEQKAVVSYDKVGIENHVKAVEDKYNGLVFTEESVVEAKSERAKLNNLKDDIDTFRKNITRELTSDIELFDKDFKSYTSRVQVVSKNIDVQVKVFEEKEIEKRLNVSMNHMKTLLNVRPQYAEFLPQLLDLVNQNKIFTLKGSYNEKGEVAKKLSDFIDQELLKYDEIISARKAAEELLKQKRELVVSQCTSLSEMLGLKIALSPKNFAYLKDYELSEITAEIQRAAKEQSEKEKETIKKIEEEATRKAQAEIEKSRIEEEKKTLETEKLVIEPTQDQSETQKEVLKAETVQEPMQEVKTTQKLFYGVLEFEGGKIEFEKCNMDIAKSFRKFLDESSIKFEVIKSEVK